MASVEEKYVYTTARESIINKDWAAGASEPVETRVLVCDAEMRISIAKVSVAPALRTVLDEPIENAVDHAVLQPEVTRISAKISESGEVTIENDGPGIDIVVHKIASTAEGRDVYLPTFVFGRLFQGGNTAKSRESVTGGTNGLGVKITNCFSTAFSVETRDGRQKFTQSWANNMAIESPPVISADTRKPGTRVVFTPDYAKFGPNSASVIGPIFRARCCAAAAYLGNKCSMSFNGVTLCRDFARFAESVAGQPGTTYETNFDGHPWSIFVTVGTTKPITYSIVNGLVVDTGAHFAAIYGLIHKHAKATRGGSKITLRQVKSVVGLVVKCRIKNTHWSNQCKDDLAVTTGTFAEFTLDSITLAAISAKIRDALAAVSASVKQPKRRIDLPDEKYRRAKKAGSAESARCSLILVEGLSAMSQVIAGITHNKKTLDFKYYGVLTTDGVIVNVRKRTKLVNVAGSAKFLLDATLKNNAFLNNFTAVTGLSIGAKYDKTSDTYAAEMAALRYGHVIACVDQDLDGKGNILGLILNIFDVYWPNLIRQGYIQWFATPVIRAYRAKEPAHEFYSVQEFKEWNVDRHGYKVYYYKGLGSNSLAETKQMFAKLSEQIYTFRRDHDARGSFETYFGSDADLRKIRLAEEPFSANLALLAKWNASRVIRCSDHLRIETDQYERDNLERKMPNVIDGQNQVGRKILDGALKSFRHTDEIKRVDAFAGAIVEPENYLHGASCLEDAITGKAFCDVGGRQLPLLIPTGNAGSRLKGGKDASSARYLTVKLNNKLVNAIFPAADYTLLKFTLGEHGKKAEPEYFVPIIPMAILEHSKVPAHGWSHEIWARDALDVISCVRVMISRYGGSDSIQCTTRELREFTHGWYGDVVTIGRKTFTIGKYNITRANPPTIVITELPLCTWTYSYLDTLRDMKERGLIVSYDNNSSDSAVNITVKLSAAPTAEGRFDDPIIDYLQLYSAMNSDVNLMFAGSVTHYSSYGAVLCRWFPVRRDLYRARIHRQDIIEDLKLLLYRNKLRFIGEFAELALTHMPKAVMIERLAEASFDRISHCELKEPGEIATIDLIAVITAGNRAKFDYLLCMNSFDKTKEAAEKLRARIAALEERVANRTADRAVKTWLAELADLAEIVTDGRANNWGV